MNDVAIQFDVLGSFMVNWIGYNLSVALLSQSKVAGWRWGTCRSCTRYRNHVSSHAVAAKDRYLACVDDL